MDACLRRIEVWMEEKKETMVFVTNNMKLAAIAAIYKERLLSRINESVYVDSCWGPR
jgi:hypothetical protein